MSIRAVTDLATERDRLPGTATTAQYADILTKTVPTESLAAYTTFVALLETQAGSGDDLLGWRWGAFVGFVGLTVVSVLTLYYSKSRAERAGSGAPPPRKAPLELVPTIISAVAWGLAMPGGPLIAQLDGPTGVLAVAAVVIAGGALVTVTGTPLRTATPGESEGGSPSPAPRVGGGERPTDPAAPTAPRAPAGPREAPRVPGPRPPAPGPGRPFGTHDAHTQPATAWPTSDERQPPSNPIPAQSDDGEQREGAGRTMQFRRPDM